MTEQEPAKSRKPAPRWMAAGALIVVALAIAASLMLGNLSRSGAAGCGPLGNATAAIDRAAAGELAALSTSNVGKSFADLKFVDTDKKPLTLKDFEGKTLLVNFWASWCIPCRAEMPALAAVAQTFDGPDFMVLPINLDVGPDGIEKAKSFLASNNIGGLPLYADPTMQSLEVLKQSGAGLGLPTTLLLDRKACSVGVLQGPAKWDSSDGANVVKALEAIKS
jgi:thiol-disulfide isomerase/thioredoxin